MTHSSPRFAAHRTETSTLRVVAIAALMLAQCGGGEAGPADDEPADTTAQAEEPGLSDEQRREIQALEAIGYVGGMTPGSGLEGVIVHDEQRACAGLNLILSAHEAGAVLAEMDGSVVHRWSKTFHEIWPDRSGGATFWRRARVLPGGELLAIFDGLGLVKLDMRSNVVWAFDGLAHHDLDIAADGRIYVLTSRAHLRPDVHPDKPILEDFVTILDPDGRELESTSLLECFKNSRYMRSRLPQAGDIFHTNTLNLLDGRHAAQSKAFAAGNVLVSLRKTNQVGVVDLRAKTVVWSLNGKWRHQHEPVLLDNGHILLFDNDGQAERSSVLEIEPATGAIVWSYSRPREGEFFSAVSGSVQRLTNGNTLIVSSMQGRAFEVTSAGEIVWEFDNPHRLPEDPTLVAAILDCVRLDPSFDTGWAE